MLCWPKNLPIPDETPEEILERIRVSSDRWNRVMAALQNTYEAWARSTTPWHEEVNDLMEAYDEWLD